jgi:myo-inositol-1(or 4)-monophosphatase
MLNPVVTVMTKAARIGGNVLLRSINKLDALNVVQKDRMDYASEVDADAEKAIIKELRRAYPEYGIVGEEGGIVPGKNGRYHWVIDPLDGTSNYLHGFGHYCVSIALVDNGEPTDAVIFDPLRNELFTASRGAGAQLNERKIRVSERKELAGAMIHTGFHRAGQFLALGHADLECVRELLNHAEDIRRTGSAALDLAYVACGRADAYFEAGVKDWDIAAGVLLVREAGGKVCDFKGASTGRMDGVGPETRQLIAGNLRVADALQKVVSASGYTAAFNAFSS